MAALDVGKILRGSHRIVRDPTDLGAAFPYGGIELGAAMSYSLDMGVEYVPLPRHSTPALADILYVGEDWALSVVLRQWDDDALGAIFPNLTSGTKNTIRSEGAVKPGSLGSARAIKLLLVARDVTEIPSILLWRAIPVLDDPGAIRISALQEIRLRVLFRTMADSTGKAGAMGLLSDLAAIGL